MMQLDDRLKKEDIRSIVDIQIAQLQNRLKQKQIVLNLTDAAKDLLGESGYDPVFGARPLKRIVQKEVQDPIAIRLLKGEVSEGEVLKVDRRKGNGSLEFVKKKN